MTTNTDIVVPEQGSRLIKPAGSIEETVEAFQAYQSLRDKLGTPDDFQTIPARGGNRTFPKKSYVRKVQRYFGLSAELIKDEPVIVKDKLIGWTATVRAKHLPTGAYQDGDGSCGIEEKSRGDMQPTIHNLRSHAVTRAKNRAVMDLVGFGDVTADEMVRDEQGEAIAQDRGTQQPQASEYGVCPEHGVEWFMRGKMRSPAHPIADTNQWCNKPDSPPDGPRMAVEQRNEGGQGDGPVEDDSPPFSQGEVDAMSQEQFSRPLWPGNKAQEFMDWALAELGKTDQAPLFGGPRDVLAILKPDDFDKVAPVGSEWNGTEMMASMSEDAARGRIIHYIQRLEGGKEGNDG